MEKVVKIVDLKEQSSDFSFWQSKTTYERLDAVEMLRSQYIKFISPDVQPRLSRICRVTPQTRG